MERQISNKENLSVGGILETFTVTLRPTMIFTSITPGSTQMTPRTTGSLLKGTKDRARLITITRRTFTRLKIEIINTQKKTKDLEQTHMAIPKKKRSGEERGGAS